MSIILILGEYMYYSNNILIIFNILCDNNITIITL